MEKKLIDSYALRKALYELAAKNRHSIAILSEVARMIRDMPAADAVPVVRCKDCRYYTPETRLNFAWCQRHYELRLCPDGYCSDGEVVDNE